MLHRPTHSSFLFLPLPLFLLMACPPVSSSDFPTDCAVTMHISQAYPECATLSQELSGVLNCSQLQHALTVITSSTLPSNFTGPVCIFLPAGEHELTFNSTSIDHDMTIVGVGASSTVVSCLPEEIYDRSQYDEFPMLFGGNVNVVLDGISFTGCGRPLLFYEIASLTIRNCDFR